MGHVHGEDFKSTKTDQRLLLIRKPERLRQLTPLFEQGRPIISPRSYETVY